MSLRFLLLLVLLAPIVLLAEEILLKEGQVIKGSVVKENNKSVFVDLGFTVFEIPKDEISKRTKEQTQEKKAEKSEPVKAEKGKMYYVTSGKNKISTVEMQVKKVQEAVVLVKTPAGLGSGFIINEEGYMITNAHVIQGQTKISITIFIENKGRIDTHILEKIKIVAVNNHRDLALLKIEEKPDGYNFSRIEFADHRLIKNGQDVFAVGNPFGLKRSVSEGIVSSVNRNLSGVSQLLIQTTAAINGGNSGGPLFNAKGEVIGVNSLGFVKSIAEGLNFAIPSKYVLDFLDNYESFAYDKNNPNNGYTYFKFPEIKITIKDDEL